MENITELINKQRAYFYTGRTKGIAFRREQLKALKNAVKKFESEIMAALADDLKKSAFESYVTEIGIVYEEINYMLKNMNRLLKARRVRTPFTQLPAVSKVYKEPYGNVLIISPWNYPFQLAIAPLVGAIACGNCCIIKTSEYAPATSRVIHKLIANTFPPSFVKVVEGGIETNQKLLEHKFDLIFFTGSTTVGRIVMEKAARHLTPVVLELGGKCPCIIDETADIKLAARRIVWGKCLNSGQTCVAPDYLLVHKKVKKQLIEEMQKNIEKFYTKHPEHNPEYPGIINSRHFERIVGLIMSSEVIYGGGMNREDNKISLALIDHVHWEDPVMQDELFGPILPMIAYDNLDTVLMEINKRPKPLALYLFTRSKKTERKVIGRVSYGGGCMNDTISHLAVSGMGFGGVGESGMGSYHGKASIETFSHSKSILRKSNLIDVPLRYSPYNNKLSVIKKIMK